MTPHSFSAGMGQAMVNAAAAIEGSAEGAANSSEQSENLIGIDEVQRSLNRSRASVYRYTNTCLLYTSPSPRDRQKSRMPSSA